MLVCSGSERGRESVMDSPSFIMSLLSSSPLPVWSYPCIFTFTSTLYQKTSRSIDVVHAGIYIYVRITAVRCGLPVQSLVY